VIKLVRPLIQLLNSNETAIHALKLRPFNMNGANLSRLVKNKRISTLRLLVKAYKHPGNRVKAMVNAKLLVSLMKW
jgi:hypothetical protein